MEKRKSIEDLEPKTHECPECGECCDCGAEDGGICEHDCDDGEDETCSSCGEILESVTWINDIAYCDDCQQTARLKHVESMRQESQEDRERDA